MYSVGEINNKHLFFNYKIKCWYCKHFIFSSHADHGSCTFKIEL